MSSAKGSGYVMREQIFIPISQPMGVAWTRLLHQLGSIRWRQNIWWHHLSQIKGQSVCPAKKPWKIKKQNPGLGSGGGTSGRTMAFCLGRLGSNPRSDFGFYFQFRIAVKLFSLGVRLFLITCNRTVHTLPSSFLLPIIFYYCKIINFKLTIVQKKGKKSRTCAAIFKLIGSGCESPNCCLAPARSTFRRFLCLQAWDVTATSTWRRCRRRRRRQITRHWRRRDRSYKVSCVNTKRCYRFK